ncbi:hypothetical protein DFH07DRAFT_965003 [Mycena maculata]|uniref:HNH nuclease domain-containing protein n=1 Tax=Mycena maculata TaxID=230809 RepID=A0AAD7N1A7_9AGAR|nr:hypothetical protein DFH07DRAFT_965003 [Mycena maculata]
MEAVLVYHPAYSPPQLLLVLPGFPTPSGYSGVPFFVVLDAARIIAQNKDGALRQQGSIANLPLPTSDRAILPPGSYEYHCLGIEYAVRVFESNFCVAGSSLRDSYRSSECQWHFHNMSGLTINQRGVNSPANCLALRADLHGPGMDGGHFVFAPYDGAAVCVCLTNDMSDLAEDYHLRALTIPGRIHPLNVYVRFAWGIFSANKTTLRDLLLAEHHENSAHAISDDGSLEAPLDLCIFSEGDIKAAEALDAHLDSRDLACYEEGAGLYPGFSKILRLEQAYRREHPEVSALRSARVARVGEVDDEQQI